MMNVVQVIACVWPHGIQLHGTAGGWSCSMASGRVYEADLD